MPVKLAELPSTFGLCDVEDKPFFPHLYNCDENLHHTLLGLPSKEDYLYRSFLPEKKKKFDVWYAENGNEPFTLSEALASYCCSDVKILLHATVELRRLYEEVTNLDILRSITIASACK
jgi:hypothetical protein